MAERHEPVTSSSEGILELVFTISQLNREETLRGSIERCNPEFIESELD
jgi:hypothetical protein